MWIDAHCHLASPRWKDGLPASLEAAKALGIQAWIQGGVGPEDWDAQQALQQAHRGWLLPCFGLHPWWVAQASAPQVKEALSLLERKLPEAAALGELGLDFLPAHVQGDARARQAEAFKAQLEIARSGDKPLVIHVVRAHPEALKILSGFGPFPRGGIVHSFSGSEAIARRYLELNLTISVGPSVLRAEALRQAIPLLPPDALVIETDAPDQKPAAFPGERNELKNLVAYATEVAELRQETTDAVLERSSSTLARIFGIAR